jgi:hypothetical protein
MVRGETDHGGHGILGVEPRLLEELLFMSCGRRHRRGKNLTTAVG